MLIETFYNSGPGRTRDAAERDSGRAHNNAKKTETMKKERDETKKKCAQAGKSVEKATNKSASAELVKQVISL